MDKHKTMPPRKKKSNIIYKRMGSELIIATPVVRSWGYDRVIKTEVQSSVKKKSQKKKRLSITEKVIENKAENIVHIYLENYICSPYLQSYINKTGKGAEKSNKGVQESEMVSYKYSKTLFVSNLMAWKVQQKSTQS